MCISQESDVVFPQVEKLQSAVAKLNNDKIALEQSMEMEEEGIVNRLQRQIGELLLDSVFLAAPGQHLGSIHHTGCCCMCLPALHALGG